MEGGCILRVSFSTLIKRAHWIPPPPLLLVLLSMEGRVYRCAESVHSSQTEPVLSSALKLLFPVIIFSIFY